MKNILITALLFLSSSAFATDRVIYNPDASGNVKIKVNKGTGTVTDAITVTGSDGSVTMANPVTASSTLTATGLITATTGIKVPNAPGGTAATLTTNVVDNGTNYTFTFNGTGSATGATRPAYISRVGNSCVISINGNTANSGTGSTAMTTIVGALASWARPSVGVQAAVEIFHAGSSEMGLMFVNTDGSFGIRRLASAPFNLNSSSGMASNPTIAYQCSN